MLQVKSKIGALGKGLFLGSLSLLMASCGPTREISSPEKTALTSEDIANYREALELKLKDPVARARLIARVLGSTEEAERHAFLKFHLFGYAGDGNIVPFFSMNNYIIQKWVPDGEGEYAVQHYEVAYYSKFDSAEAISEWENPLTGEIVELPHFVLGPLPRVYGVNVGKGSNSFASDPLNITMIGDRVYIPTLTSITAPNSLKPEEWGPYSNGPTIYWDSMQVFSASAEEALDESNTHVPAEIHMQNLVSFAPFLKLGQQPGRTMVRSYGQHISGFDDLPAEVRENLEKYTPEIFNIDEWTELRLDSVDLEKELHAKRDAGTLDIDQADYVPFKVKPLSEINK